MTEKLLTVVYRIKTKQKTFPVIDCNSKTLVNILSFLDIKHVYLFHESMRLGLDQTHNSWISIAILPIALWGLALRTMYTSTTIKSISKKCSPLQDNACQNIRGTELYIINLGLNPKPSYTMGVTHTRIRNTCSNDK